MQQLNSSVLNSIILGRNYFCCLCFKTVADSAIHIEDKVIVKRADQTLDEVDMIDILTNILDPETHDNLKMFNAVCNKCSLQAIRCYKFYSMCKDNSKKLANIIGGLTSGIETCLSKANNSKAGFISINTENFKSKAYTSKQSSATKLLAHQKFQSLLRNKEAKRSVPDALVASMNPETGSVNNPITLILRPRLKRLHPKILQLGTVYVCPECDLFYKKRPYMLHHLRNKHRTIDRRTEDELIRWEPVITKVASDQLEDSHPSLIIVQNKPEVNIRFSGTFQIPNLNSKLQDHSMKVPNILKRSKTFKT